MMAMKRAPFDIQFIDLNGVEESERKWILSSLHTSNPNVRLPWVKQSRNVCSYEAEAADATVPPMVNGTGVPVSSYGPPGSFHLQGKCPPPVLFMHRPPTAPFKVNNSITEAPFKNGYCNSYQDTNGIGDDDHAKEVNNNVNGIKQDLIIVDKKEEVVAPSPQTTKSWASVLKPKEQEAKVVVTAESKPPKAVVVIEKPPVPEIVLKEPFQSNRDDPNLHRMGEFLTTHTIDSRITSLQPRGLINRSNYCYINSILQAVMACPPVYNLFSGLADTLMSTQTKKVTPIIDGMIRLVKEFQHLPSGLRVGRRLNKTQKDKQYQVAINCDTPIEAHWMNTIFNGVRSDTFIVEGRQEDAEEFFGCLLNGLNDEMLELLKLVGAQNTTSHTIGTNQEEDKEWQVMGPKNKGSITRRTELNRTPIIDIFGGLLRSRVQRAGDQTTDNIQPFFTLQLNVEKSQNIRDALEHLVNKNQLEGVTSLKTNEEIEAWQQVTIDKLPLVLVFHVKCFDYQVDGCSKITKALEFPIDLKIEPKVLSAAYNAKERQYKLFAVVYHEGKEATKGHYVTDTYHVGYANWLHYDDASVKPIPEERVLKPGGTRVPYLLFYRRNDTIANNNINNKK